LKRPALHSRQDPGPGLGLGLVGALGGVFLIAVSSIDGPFDNLGQ
jgi:hypothetical protein